MMESGTVVRKKVLQIITLKLLIASGALNLVLALGWVLTARKKAIRQDNMPLVDYDIDDDDPA